MKLLDSEKREILKLVEADRMGSHVFFIIGAAGYPQVGYGKLEGGVGIGLNRYPFIGVYCCSIVEIRADIYLLDPNLGPEETKLGGYLPHKT